MSTAPMPCIDQEMPHANDDEDGTPREDTQEIQPQEMDNAPLDVVLNDCRVEMVSLDAIYVEGDQHDDDLVTALAHSIGLIGLQNPICIVENDIEGHPATYQLVSGRKRYAAFLQLERQTIPAHILSYAETDRDKDVRTALAATEENLVRKHYSLIEICELVGQAKDMYERIHPETKQGKAPKKKHSGTESLPKPLAYLDVAAQQLQKSRATVWKYIYIYNKFIQGQPAAFAALKRCDHPILSKLEDLQELAKSPDLVPLTDVMCGKGLSPGANMGKPCMLQEAKIRLEQCRAKEAREKEAQKKVVNHAPSQETDTTASPEEPPVDQPSAHDSSTDRPEMAHNGSSPPAPTRQALPLHHLLNQMQEDLRRYFEDLHDPHTFSVQISQEHNAVHFVFSSTLSQPEDVTNLPAQCPGWGLHNASAEICGTCPYKTRCEEAQTVLTCED